MKCAKDRGFSRREQEIMEIIYRRGQATAEEVLAEELAPEGEVFEEEEEGEPIEEELSGIKEIEAEGEKEV